MTTKKPNMHTEHIESSVRKTTLRFLFSRSTIVIFIFALQILVLFLLAQYFGKYVTFMYGGLSVILAVILMNRKTQPAYTQTWMLLIILTPVFGGLLYFFVQLNLGTALMRKDLIRLSKETLPYRLPNPITLQNLRKENERAAGTATYLQEKGSYPVYQNTDVSYYGSGEELFEKMMEQLEDARSFIFIESFIVAKGHMLSRLLRLLKKKAAQGVEVRFMYDGTCTIGNLPYHYPEYIRKLGIQCKMFEPLKPVLSTSQNNRDHRKLVIIDGVVAFNGGTNIADEYINEKVRFGHWKDSGIMVRGEAVQNMTMMFLELWNVREKKPENYRKYLTPKTFYAKSNAYVVPFGDSPFDPENIAEHVYLDLIYAAKKYCHITTPYFIVGYEMVQALTYAAKRGVDVEIILPHIPDKWYAFALARTYYVELISAGVKIYEYTPGFIHAKSFVVDDMEAVVGTINMDYRSLYLNFECGTFFCNASAVADVEIDYQKTRAKSQEMTIHDYYALPWYYRLGARFLRLLAPLF